MVYNQRTPVKAKYVFANITAVVSDTTASQFTDNPFWNFWGFYYGGDGSAYVDLGFPEGTLTASDVPFPVSAAYYQRLDHIAKDLEITFPKTETTKEYYLGTQSSTGAQNSVLVTSEPDLVNVKLTLRGAVSNLSTLAASAAATSPSGYTRLNYGSQPTTTFGLAILTTTNITAPTDSDAVTIGYFINNCRVITVGTFTKVDSEGYAEATFEIEGEASDLWEEIYTTQHSTTQNA